MQQMKSHKDLDVWRAAVRLAKETYQITNSFPKEEQFGLGLQLRRSTVSIAREALIKSHMRDRSAFVPCIPVRSIGRHSTHTLRTSIGTKALRSLVRDEFYWVASGAASATLRALPRYLPWLHRDASHPSAPDTTCSSSLRRRLTSLAKLRAEPGRSHNARRETQSALP